MSPDPSPESTTTPTPEESTGTPTPEESTGTTLAGVLAELQARLDQLTANLETSQANAETATRQRSQTSADLKKLQKAADAIDGVRDDAAPVRAQAEAAKTAAKATIESLGDDDVAALTSSMDAINQAYRDKEDALRTAQEELAAQQADAGAKDAEAAWKKEALDAAYAALSDIPASVRAQLSSLTSLMRELKSATDGGQAMKAWVVQKEMDAALEQVDSLLSQASIDALVTSYDTKRKELDAALDAQAQAANAVDAKREAARDARDALKQAGIKRRQDLAALYVASKTPA